MRLMKMDKNNKSVLIYALHADYKARKEAEQPYADVGDLLLRVSKAAGGLHLNDAEFRILRDALNQLRNDRLAAGCYTDAVDDALCKLLKARRPLGWRLQ